jgi:hypothetical protein
MSVKLSTRVEPLEENERRAWKAIGALAKKQEKLDDALVVLLEAQVKTEERFQELGKEMKDGFRETKEGFREMREGFRETKDRFRETDARIAALGASLDDRIGKLVSAIGELVRRDGRAK